jgi:hypothetical protein
MHGFRRRLFELLFNLLRSAQAPGIKRSLHDLDRLHCHADLTNGTLVA